MMRLPAFLASLVMATGAMAADTAATQRIVIEPFTAHYAVYMDGQQRGESTIRLERTDRGSWRYSVSAEGTSGMARLAGFEADDRSEFDIGADGELRLQWMESRSKALFKSRKVSADFDWSERLAIWSGDLKDDRRAPTPLSDKAVNSSLLNLALALDAAKAGDNQVFRYQMLDRGSSKEVEYVAQRMASVEVPAGRFEARPMRRDRRDKDRVVTAWYAPNLPPTPVRLLQTDNGKPRYELRLLRID
ncbi:MAG: DUF3108 domain-containing protein [Rhodanobacteraceae bacterium]|nr:DUF3108 domain-containing protein [Xanthomonadales bacterium]MCP5478108.1 DUF3108 domain-containing protein [Rhodanobacteraceae bacterium]HPF74754.1 DUF3108 domain-containing protein [Xanthomonadaceae bacterium]HRY01206.1 DUF3108 domain-containing protein [Xanthomonadaceae bacterium]